MSRSLVWLALLLARAVFGQVAAGDAALAKFDLDAALKAYRKVPPGDYEATWKLCRALTDKATLTPDKKAKKALLVEAEQLARSAVALQPSDSKGHAYLAIAVGQLALFEGGKRKVELSKEVRAEAERALTLNPDEDVAHHTLAIWHREMSQLNWVLRKFAEVLYGKFPSASLDDARSHLETAVKLMPGSVPHRVELGLTYRAAGKKKEASDQFEKARALPQSWVTDDHYRGLIPK